MLVPEAKAALEMWTIVFTLLEVAVEKCKCEVIIEQPVKRWQGSLFAIPGKEWHTTVYDTSIGKTSNRSDGTQGSAIRSRGAADQCIDAEDDIVPLHAKDIPFGDA